MRRKAVLLTVVLSLSCGSAQAMGLLDAWELALRNDAQLRRCNIPMAPITVIPR